jgi:hypothetical protein
MMHLKKSGFTILTLSILVFANSCIQPDSHAEAAHTSDTEVDHIDTQHTEWHNVLIENYIRNADNELLKLTRSNSSLKIEWLREDDVVTDTARYLVFHIGHEVSDKGGDNPRFITDAWIYINSSTRKIYEYDIDEESLGEWNQ